MTTKLTPARRKMHLKFDTTTDFIFVDDIKYQEALRSLQEKPENAVMWEVDLLVFNHIELPSLFAMLGRAVKVPRKPAMKRAAKPEQFTLKLAA